MKHALLVSGIFLLMAGNAYAEYCRATGNCWARCSNGCYAIYFPDTGECSAGCCFADGSCIGTKEGPIGKPSKSPRDYSVAIRGLAPAEMMKLLQDKTRGR
jgi:hypothetical protein